ncbi:hypothetical protein GOC91_04155 [Sinorhizobium medicae]|uniref:Uncharacterized protein n=2 Tax=Sinorhizobium medicae TaxID=110321 RepID=A0A508X663_9HYPH|nr:hypothetical protein Smed_0269 [Sinorhizobium medicae WSM419]MDX0406149.1 hypothetical protein [Sinorhizobium medicae]MDX0412917.1 hypothetical protein [Sinorhizobium medicae]MDX0417888.1 hypothetical protein [Sinorhizobium medicae]MDX0422303.1 hypothetical protein [Sinorhizobium medicae]
MEKGWTALLPWRGPTPSHKFDRITFLRSHVGDCRPETIPAAACIAFALAGRCTNENAGPSLLPAAAEGDGENVSASLGFRAVRPLLQLRQALARLRWGACR